MGYGFINQEHLHLELIKIWVSFPYQGKGLCKDALKLAIEHAFDMGYRTIYYRVSKLNETSRRLAEKLGFKLEVDANEFVIMYGKVYDYMFYSLSRVNEFNRFS